MPIKQNKLEVKCPGPWVLPTPANGLQAGGCFSGEGNHLSLGNAPPWDRVAGGAHRPPVEHPGSCSPTTYNRSGDGGPQGLFSAGPGQSLNVTLAAARTGAPLIIPSFPVLVLGFLLKHEAFCYVGFYLPSSQPQT